MQAFNHQPSSASASQNSSPYTMLHKIKDYINDRAAISFTKYHFYSLLCICNTMHVLITILLQVKTMEVLVYAGVGVWSAIMAYTNKNTSINNYHGISSTISKS